MELVGARNTNDDRDSLNRAEADRIEILSGVLNTWII